MTEDGEIVINVMEEINRRFAENREDHQEIMSKLDKTLGDLAVTKSRCDGLDGRCNKVEKWKDHHVEEHKQSWIRRWSYLLGFMSLLVVTGINLFLIIMFNGD